MSIVQALPYGLFREKNSVRLLVSLNCFTAEIYPVTILLQSLLNLMLR